MAGSLKVRNKTITSSATRDGGLTWEAFKGPGVLLGIEMDDVGDDVTGMTLTLYDSAQDPTVAGIIPPTTVAAALDQAAINADLGVTTPPARVFQDGSVVATLATESANTHLGFEFFDGLTIVKSGDTTHAAGITLYVRPLIKKSVNLRGSTVAGVASTTSGTVRVFEGAGLLRAVRAMVPTTNTTGIDLAIKDKSAARTLITATNYDFATQGGTRKIWNPVTTTSIDDTGAAVTTAATGAYCNDGVLFRQDLSLTWASATTDAFEGSFDFLIEA